MAIKKRQKRVGVLCNVRSITPGRTPKAGSVHSPSTSMATSSQYRQLLSDYGPPSLGYTQGTGNSQVPQSKYAELLAIIEELGKEIRPTYAGSKSAMERLKRGIIHARGLVRECLAETERNARS
ncbi:cyclin-dependent kinase 2-associated protein 1 isoform X3 [Heterocephalus glaber]|uniref:Cyclin-dependent kinase 2-associated protein n=1 Tax=Heterocephalus glaber TaxID=10181 RepID=A0AAX6QVQ0_HETGA|nr:cyclin-dependent kinase 2-associated protein 1 isoform X3 [Heterocephalus glaber]